MSNANANFWLAIIDDDVPETTPEITNDKDAHAARVKEMTDGNISFNYIPVLLAAMAPKMLKILRDIDGGGLAWREFSDDVKAIIDEAEGGWCMMLNNSETSMVISLLSEIKAMTEHLTQDERNEYFDLRIKKAEGGV